MTLFCWFHPKGNQLINHKLFGLGQSLCHEDCALELIVGDIGSTTAKEGTLGVRVKHLTPSTVSN